MLDSCSPTRPIWPPSSRWFSEYDLWGNERFLEIILLCLITLSLSFLIIQSQHSTAFPEEVLIFFISCFLSQRCFFFNPIFEQRMASTTSSVVYPSGSGPQSFDGFTQPALPVQQQQQQMMQQSTPHMQLQRQMVRNGRWIDGLTNCAE